MRIAILISELRVEGGGERQAVYLARELQDMGHEVVVYTQTHDPQRCYPQACAQLPIVVTGEHPLARLPIPSRRLRDYLNARHLARCLRAPFDVLNPHHWPPHWAAVWVARRNSPQPPVVWMCNDPPWPSEPPLSGSRGLVSSLRSLLGRVFLWHDLRTTRHISRTVVLSHYAKGLVDATYGTDCTVIRSGVDLASSRLDDPAEAASIRRQHAIRPDAFLLLALGILMPHRRLEDALAGVAAAVAEGRDIHFLIAGSPDQYPDYEQRLRALAHDLGLDQHVTFAGTVLESKLPLYYSACDAFVFPNENQTWALAVTEAMASRKPVIVSTGCGVAEVLTHEENALLVPPRRPDLVALQIRRLMDDRGLAEAIAHAGYELVSQTLSWRRYAENMVGVFEGVAGKVAADHPASPVLATGAAPGHSGKA